MRAGLSTIQQTLTPEAASVLNHSIAEAGRRNHGQTTPLHVAATLLASPSGFLRQACIKSHPNSSHPLQCRALELCFSVALERLPTAQNMSPGMEPPISNALMAALKRAQAHQRRGCPEQQQQPLLAVKVELEQLIISILDDPSVSRVMREASFSSPAVKATIEQSLNSSPSTVNSIGLGFRPTTVTPAAPSSRNLYLNPRLQQGSATQLAPHRGDEVRRVVDILLRTKKRNPVLVGESEPEAVIRELLKRIENKELSEGPFNNAHVIYLEKEIPSDRAQIPAKLKELGDLIETRMGNSGCGGVFVYLGDLKWLVEQPVGFGVAGLGNNMQQQALTEAGRSAVAEMGSLVARFGEAGAGRLWLLGTATCETYLRCQVYHQSMENDWDLQAVPITTRASLPAMFPRVGTNGILGSSLEPLSPLKGFPSTAIASPRLRAPENLDPARGTTCCPQCKQNYEQELADALKDIEKSDSEVESKAACPSLPQWLQNAKSNSDNAKVKEQKSNSQEVVKKRTEELKKKWHDSCLHLHPKFHQQSLSTERISPTPFSMISMCNPNFLGHQSQPKLQLNKNLGGTLQSSSNPVLPNQPSEQVISPLGSPIRTELALGQTRAADSTADQTHENVKDFLGLHVSELQDKFNELQSTKLLDADSYKKLLKGLAEKVWWQQDAASAVATAVTQCKLGNGKTRRGGTKGDVWLLFVGPDRVGKQKMAAALSELVSGSNPIIICVGPRRGDGESDGCVRGKTALDRIAEAVRRNPFSVIMLEDIDEADLLIRGSIKRAMERGRFTDSYGREISLGNVMFILTASGLPDNLKYLSNGTSLDEEKIANLAKNSLQLRLSLSKKTIKRRPSWLSDEERSRKPRKETNSGLAFDLNEAADAEDRADGSLNSSDLTVDHEDNQVLNNGRSPSSLVPRELLDAVDDAIVFKPVEFGLVRRNFWSSITKKFSSIIGNGVSIEVQEDALVKITGGVWLSQTSIDEWIAKVMVPSFQQLKTKYNPINNSDESFVVKLEEDDGDSDSRRYGEWLPASVRLVVEDC